MIALITGATGGIGAATALKFAQAGYDVAIHSSLRESSCEKAKELAQQCRGFGVAAETFAADIADTTSCEEMVKAVKARFGQIDVLVNNAGITDDGLLLRMSEESYDRVITTNQKSVFTMMKLVGSVMLRKKYGRIINLSSVAGLYGNVGQVNYAAAKAAVIGMTKAAAKELGGKNITVNAIAPGFIETPMTDVLPEDRKNMILERTALNRFGQPEEVEELALFLANAGYITGETIEISGGLSM